MAKIKQLPTRQRYRKALLFLSLLLFPVTLYYFSPVLAVQAAAGGIVNASLIVFGLMFFSALLLGRLWCGWACPAGALQEFGAAINDKSVARVRLDWIKWAIWLPWIGLIVLMAVRAGGYHAVNPFYQFEGGVTLALPLEPETPPWFTIYYVIIALFLGLALVLGRRGACHTICWMAPFMILGRKLRNLARWPALRLKAAPEQCIDCGRCDQACLMSLDVNRMVKEGNMEHSECILCGNCVDACPKDVIIYVFSAGK